MNYKILWTDMHSNLHHEKIKQLPQWYEQISNTMDFWPFAYYPYYMRKDVTGLGVEDKYPEKEINEDWEYIRKFTKEANSRGFPMFMGYEWQGSGEDGDHNVFFKDNDQNMEYPLRYQELVECFNNRDAIGIPHHLAYHEGDRGKNWSTHNDKFSPFVETYSSHGSSESDDTPIGMTRHIHMGPRTGKTCVEKGLEMNHRFGIIASGDNHSCPGVYGFGQCAVLSTGNTKEEIWDAFINRRVYGTSINRIKLDYKVDDSVMGAIIKGQNKATMELNVEGGNALDRIEIIADNRVIEMIPHTSTYEGEEITGVVRVKFHLELGWGPDRRLFPDIESRKWHGELKTPGKLISIEKCWSTFGQRLYNVEDNSCEFNLTSYKTTATGKWMGLSGVTTEGFIFEIEDDINSTVQLIIDSKNYNVSIRDILDGGELFVLQEEAEELLKSTFNFDTYYRSDPWWHNAYKIKINKGAVERGYKRSITREIDTTNINNLRVRVWQKNGACAWSSPIFFENKGK